MIKYYDKTHHRIAFFSAEVLDRYWEKQWQSYAAKQPGEPSSGNSFIIKMTRRYLPSGSRILEGGCGLADKVASLRKAGFKVCGVDRAQDALRLIGKHHPQLPVCAADVRFLPFGDSTFDGYWSLGVIEHFLNGYNEVLAETRRVLKKNGYLFITFPVMSPIRTIKARLNKYPELDISTEGKHFYQFALDPREVKRNIQNEGFRLIHERNIAGLKGFKDEVGIFKNCLQKVFEAQTLFLKSMHVACNGLFSYYFGHSRFFVFQKK